MSKFCGIVSYNFGHSDFLISSVASYMDETRNSHALRNCFSHCKHIFPSAIFFTFALPDEEKYSIFYKTDDNSLFCMVAGHISATKDLWDRLGWKPPGINSSTVDAGFILRAYQKLGDNVFEYLDGIFSCAIFNTVMDELVLVNDKLGIYPLYICHDDSYFIFASEADAVILAMHKNKTLDYDAITHFLIYGTTLGGRTFDRAVHNIASGTILKIRKKSSTTLKRYYNFSPRERSFHGYKNHSDNESLSREFLDILMNAISKHFLEEPVTVKLSGGLDSRLILAALKKMGIDVIAETHVKDTMNYSVDLTYSKHLTNILKINHEVIQTPEISCSERILGITHIPIRAFNGICGAEILGGRYLRKSFHPISNYPSDILSDQALSQLEDYPNDAVIGDIDSINLNDLSMRKIYFLLYQSVRAFMDDNCGIRWERPNYFFFGCGLYPFLDIDVLNFIFSLKSNVLSNHKFQTNIFKRHFSEYLKVPWTARSYEEYHPLGGDQFRNIIKPKSIDRNYENLRKNFNEFFRKRDLYDSNLYSNELVKSIKCEEIFNNLVLTRRLLHLEIWFDMILNGNLK